MTYLAGTGNSRCVVKRKIVIYAEQIILAGNKVFIFQFFIQIYYSICNIFSQY